MFWSPNPKNEISISIFMYKAILDASLFWSPNSKNEISISIFIYKAILDVALFWSPNPKMKYQTDIKGRILLKNNLIE